MKKNTKLIDSLFEKAINEHFQGLINFPFFWEIMGGNDFAEWSNIFIDDIGDIHKIRLNVKKHLNEADLYDTICHELIHAVQYEEGLEIDHGPYFCEWVAYFCDFGINAASSECDAKEIFIQYCNRKAA